jgi:hypothetical protein
MNRRDFIKLSAVAAASVFTNLGSFGKLLNQPVEIELGEKIIRGTMDGKIFASLDSGKSWQTHTTFAEEVSVLELAVDRTEQLYAQLGFHGHSFQVKLAQDGHSWIAV